MIKASALPLLELATEVATKLFPQTPLDELPAGLTGPIMTHATVIQTLLPHSPLPLVPVTEPPIAGVRKLLLRR